MRAASWSRNWVLMDAWPAKHLGLFENDKLDITISTVDALKQRIMQARPDLRVVK